MADDVIFIARQNTLENEIIPAQWVNDYKLHGENSFVFNTPDLWHKMCIHPYTVNDRRVNGDALEYVLAEYIPGGTYSLSNWMALLCDTAEEAEAGLYAGVVTADDLARSSAAMAAVANSETAMAAVAGSEIAMNAICSVEMALQAFHESPHWDEIVKENSMAIAKAAVALANSNEFSVISSVAEMAENSSAMSAVAASATAMSAVADSNTARTAISASEYYNQYIKENDMAIAKLAVGFAGLASAGYSGMAGVAADATAMTAVAASSTAMTAVAASSTAMTAVAASSTAMTAVAASSTAMTAVADSNEAMTKICANSTAKNALKKSPLKKSKTLTYSSANTQTIESSGVCIMLSASCSSDNTDSSKLTWTFKTKKYGSGSSSALVLSAEKENIMSITNPFQCTRGGSWTSEYTMTVNYIKC